MDNRQNPPDVGKWKYYIRGVTMSKRNYTHVQELLSEIEACANGRVVARVNILSQI